MTQSRPAKATMRPCQECAAIAESADPSRRVLATTFDLKTHLLRCETCGAWWIRRCGQVRAVDEPGARAVMPGYFASGLDKLETLRGTIRDAVLAAEGLGEAVGAVEEAGAGLIVYMRRPMTAETRAHLRGLFPNLTYFQAPATEEGPAQEGLIDLDARAAISFPDWNPPDHSWADRPLGIA